jgi:hypothetical protein
MDLCYKQLDGAARKIAWNSNDMKNYSAQCHTFWLNQPNYRRPRQKHDTSVQFTKIARGEAFSRQQAILATLSYPSICRPHYSLVIGF